ncbi:MAG: peptidoglycan-binding domain-containing protein [Halothiobacillus sp.]|jgi:hypothetical protein|nr:peptidoglycan-binding domain-containing protein [Halothiobacillus sp.]
MSPLPNSADSDASVETTVEELRQKPEILQRRLNHLGYDVGAIDGHPGPQTRQALMGFQVENCLPPTGQPDLATAIALIETNGLVAPCAGARFPVGIEANTPLKEGIYVDTPALCNVERVSFETAHLQQRIVRGSSITWGQEGGCQTHRTDIRDGVTLFRGTCHGGNASSESAWRFDVLSNEAFIDLDMPTAMPHDALPRRFTKCSDESTLRVTWDAWFN